METNVAVSSDVPQKIRQIAEKLDVFPVDLIARKGPFRASSSATTLNYRIDLSLDQFLLFFEFCDIALKAAPEDVSGCIERLQNDTPSPKEAALLLALLYISTKPRCEPLPATKYEENLSLLRMQVSWLDMMLLTNSFELTNNITGDVGRNTSDVVKAIIESFKDDQREAFSAFTFNSTTQRGWVEHWENYSKSIMDKIDRLGIDRSEGKFDSRVSHDIIPEMYQQEYFTKMAQLYPDRPMKTRAEFAYATFTWRRGGGLPSDIKFTPNLSKTPKTIGQIAQQLLESWSNENDTITP